jgi:hypothetical protein
MQSGLNFTFPFQKINQEQRIVTGIATADNPDLVDDVVNFDASVEAFSNWVGNIREMHSPVAVGKLVDWKKVPVQHEGETYQGIEVSVYISKGAESTWQKILDGTLRGFSIGGYVKDSKKKLSEKLNRQINEITQYTLGELSVVDNPCNPAGMFAMIKSVDGQLEYVAESVQDVFYCEDDRYAAVGGDSTCAVCSEEMIIIGRSEEYDKILINKFIETINDSFEKALSDINTVPTDAMAAEAKRGLEWRKEFNRGGTPVGVARARDIMNKDTLSISTVRRMHSFFSRHEVDKQGKGFTPGDGYPSAGRIAWALWGGDPGQTWARAITNRIKAMDKGVGTDVEGMSVDGPSQIISEISKAPAAPSEQIRGSDANEPGSASGRTGGITVSAATEQALRNKAKEHNDKMEGRPEWTRVTLGQLKAVYRRGAGAFSTSHRPGMNRNQWAIARVNAFLYLSRTGRPENSKYITDYDLLDSDHPKSSSSKKVYFDSNESAEEMNKNDYMCKYCDDTEYLMKDMSCPECDGEGKMSDGADCEYCNGEGVMMKDSYCVYCKAIGTGEIGSGGGGIKKPQQGIKPEDRMSKIMPEPTPTQEIVIQVLRRTVSEAAAIVTDDIYETPDTMEESMVSKNEKEGDLHMNKNYDNMSDMANEDFTDTQKQNILSKLGSFLFGKDSSVEKGQVVDVVSMNHNLKIVSEGNMDNAPRVTINVGGGMLEESVGSTTPKADITNATRAETVSGDSSLTGQGPGEFALEEVTIKSVDSQTDIELSVTEGEEEMDFEKVLEGLGALLDEKLEKVKADITAEVDGKIDAIEKSVSEAKDAADELSGELEKVANSGAGKKSADIEADGFAEDEVLAKSAESESFWGGMFVPTEVVKALGYDS